jgi:hypothetical protein
MNKRVPTEQEIAKKHGVSVEYVTRQAEIGSTVEREHVTTHEEAYGIALQHVMEFPDYYKHLLPMEKALKKEWKAKEKKMKSFKELRTKIKEDHIPIAMGKMLDSEGGMIKNQLETIERSVELLRAQIKSDDMQVPAWVQAKVTLATENILTCANYMAGKDEGTNEEVVYEEEKKEKEEKRFCRLCQKPETQKECSYGPKAWTRFSVPLPMKKEEVDLSDHFELEEGAAWTRKAGQNKNGGLNEKGRKSYEREHPGSDLKAPSKKKGNKRRASFCARMKGMKAKLTSKKTARDPDSRINKSLRAWNC